MPRCRQPVAEMPTFRKPGDEMPISRNRGIAQEVPTSRNLLPKCRHLCLHLGRAVRISKG